MSCHHHHHSNHRHKRFSSLAEFDIINEIGKGGFSIVYLVKHIDTGRYYALKAAMRIKKGKDRSSKARKEIEFLSRLRHRRIIRIKGWFEDEDNIYMVLQYLPDGDLSKYFKTELPSKTEAVRITKQIVESVKYCHRKGIMHRDLKLNNVLIDKNMNIKLTDFGLCTDRIDEILYDEVGTPRYTAPEILEGSGYDKKVDVWGIGIILFLMLTGKYPFDGSNRKSIHRRIKEKSINYEKYDLSDQEIHLLGRLLCKNPQYRIELDDILNHPWFENSN